MASTFGWLDQDDAQRKAMLSVVELFKDEGTVDELGIGAVRDFFADSLFPGTSVLLTRARYLVMIPWLLRATCATSKDPAAGLVHLRQLEGRLIHSLLNGGETDGVIGRQAKEKLKRMPSTAYWAALGHFGVRDPKLTIEGLLRTEIGARRRLSKVDTPDDPGAEREAGPRSLHPDLPPAPEDLLEAAKLTLTTREADFLSEQIRKTTSTSLTAWLLEHGVPPEDGYAWEQSAVSTFPDRIQTLLDAGRRFHTVVHGAALAYNRMLATARRDDELIQTYDDHINEWHEELELTAPLAGWSTPDLWALVREGGKTVAGPTQAFLSAWVREIEHHGVDACRTPRTRTLIKDRELALKRGRARLVNPDALTSWTGASGLVRLDYRWFVAARLVRDIQSPQDEAA